MELNEDERARMLADARLYWQMDHEARGRQQYRDGVAAAEAKYQPLLAAKDQVIEVKDQEIEELRRKLRETGIEE
jgi:hypothetical protein